MIFHAVIVTHFLVLALLCFGVMGTEPGLANITQDSTSKPVTRPLIHVA